MRECHRKDGTSTAVNPTVNHKVDEALPKILTEAGGQLGGLDLNNFGFKDVEASIRRGNSYGNMDAKSRKMECLIIGQTNGQCGNSSIDSLDTYTL
jgi:hypothetical protein